MAVIPEAQVQLLSTPDTRGLVYDSEKEGRLWNLLDWVPAEGHQVNVVSVGASGLDIHAGVETQGGALVATVPSITSTTYKIARVSALLEVETASVRRYSQDVLQAQLEIKRRAIFAKMQKLLFQGVAANPGEFDGLGILCVNFAQRIGADGDAANGGTVAKGELELLRSKVSILAPDARIVFLMNASALKHITTTNYRGLTYVDDPRFGRVPLIGDVPILLDNFISAVETKGTNSNTTSIYCVVLDAFRGLHGVYPSRLDGPVVTVQGPTPDSSAGIDRYQLGLEAGLAVNNKGAIARLDGVAWQNLT